FEILWNFDLSLLSELQGDTRELGDLRIPFAYVRFI
ncbi:MAG: hypothetical protein ACI82O_002406, partial [Patiriisocius sp.]